MNNYEKGKKVYLNDWLLDLYLNIEQNISLNTLMFNKSNDVVYQRYIDRDIKLKNKLDTYKKIDTEGNTYFYFFSSELIDFLWIFLENNYYKGGDKNA